MQKVSPSFYVVCYILIILFIIAAFVTGMIKRSIRQNKSFTIFCSVSTIFLAAGLLWLVMDVPPPENDYVKKDVIQESNGSYTYLNIFNKADTDMLKRANQKIGESYKGKVSIKAFDQVWEKIANYRQAIEALDKFNVICDLPKGEKLDNNYSILRFTALREVSNIYRKYFLLKLSQGKGEEAATHLCSLYRMVRRGMADSTILINKMMFNSLVSQIMDTAYVAVLNKKCDEKTLLILKENFTFLNIEELSLTRPVIAEYIISKNTMREELSPETFLDSFILTSDGMRKEKNSFAPASSLTYYLGFKPNRSLVAMKKYYELIIEAQEAFPVKTAKVDKYLEEYSKRPPIRNMVGWILNSIGIPSFENYYNKTEKTKIKGDLLALAIHKKLNKPFEIKDLYTKASYEYREKPGFLEHPGKDGEFDTRDDIILGVK
jgi:hypothetical protein